MIRRFFLFGIFASLLLILAGCETNSTTDEGFAKKVNPDFQKDASNSEYIHRSMKALTDVIVHDIFSPPVASRIYTYPSIAAYEILQHANPEYQKLEGQLRA